MGKHVVGLCSRPFDTLVLVHYKHSVIEDAVEAFTT